jgi:hypothetical protein
MTESLGSATIFSLAADPPRALPHNPEAVFDSATLVSGETRHAAALQKLSAVGATLRTDAELAVGDALELELGNGQRVPGRTVWAEDGAAGFVFDAPLDVIGALAHTLARLPADRRRLPRVELDQTVSIRRGNKVDQARTRNLSQGGAGIETRLELQTGEPVQLVFDGLRPFGATVRWVQSGQAGLAFDEELGWQTLMPWLRNVQQSAIAARPRPNPIHGEPDGIMPDKQAIRLDAPARVRAGVQWWNAKVRALTSQLVELETRANVLPGTQLWVSLPEIGGGPVSVIEARQDRILCEFRLPLRPSDLGLLSGARLPG